MELSIECRKRSDAEKPKALRREGLMPAVLYGHQGNESVSLVINAKEADTVVRKASINNTLINLNVPDMPWQGQALLREVQTHPWKNEIYHISFFSIAAQDSVQVVVPVHYVGIPYGVSQEGGTLDVLVNELAINCAPGAIPEVVEVDVSSLKVGQNLHISDLTLPAGVTAAAETDQTVANVLAPRKVEGDGGATAAVATPGEA
ncbi:MAG: 50S ribosomal protein L25/general stress protein Ctc [Cyanobacteria bacterium]|nr:50S ribosomal protein L25/general stress protein Ctc [Cyanobacteriota bacterium]MEB3268149.1 50S ribosomal protein L25/general stress protein Ctc [Leptolyngbya sp.]